MRLVSLCCMMLLVCGLALGQTTVIRGTASNWVPVYAAPFVPMVTTPEITLSTVSPWSAGASSRAFGLVAGATNSTLSDEFVGDSPVGPMTQPLWYQPSAEPEYGTSGGVYGGPMIRGEGAHGMHHREAAEQAFDFISQPRESREGVAALMGETARSGKAARSITNQDVQRQNDKNGYVKYDGKTEHI